VIDFRYHVVSIVAIFLALATGIALGAGPLKGGIDQQLVDEAQRDREDKEALRMELDLAAQSAEFQDKYAEATSAQLLDARLDGRTVAIVTLPGAEDDIAAGVADDVAAAGGSVTARLQVQPELLDPQNRQVAEGLAASVLEGVEGVPNPADASSYELVGYSIARGFLSTDPAGTAIDDPARTITASLREAEYVTTDGNVERRAGLAVVVAAAPDAAEQGQEELVTLLLAGLDDASGGVVLVGDPASATEGGYVRATRDSDAAEGVSTVDVADTVAGRVVTVLALAEQAEGESGHYGAVDADDGPMPEAAAS